MAACSGAACLQNVADSDDEGNEKPVDDLTLEEAKARLKKLEAKQEAQKAEIKKKKEDMEKGREQHREDTKKALSANLAKIAEEDAAKIKAMKEDLEAKKEAVRKESNDEQRKIRDGRSNLLAKKKAQRKKEFETNKQIIEFRTKAVQEQEKFANSQEEKKAHAALAEREKKLKARAAALAEREEKTNTPMTEAEAKSFKQKQVMQARGQKQQDMLKWKAKQVDWDPVKEQQTRGHQYVRDREFEVEQRKKRVDEWYEGQLRGVKMQAIRVRSLVESMNPDNQLDSAHTKALYDTTGKTPELVKVKAQIKEIEKNMRKAAKEMQDKVNEGYGSQDYWQNRNLAKKVKEETAQLKKKFMREKKFIESSLEGSKRTNKKFTRDQRLRTTKSVFESVEKTAFEEGQLLKKWEELLGKRYTSSKRKGLQLDRMEATLAAREKRQTEKEKRLKDSKGLSSTAVLLQFENYKGREIEQMFQDERVAFLRDEMKKVEKEEGWEKHCKKVRQEAEKQIRVVYDKAIKQLKAINKLEMAPPIESFIKEAPEVMKTPSSKEAVIPGISNPNYDPEFVRKIKQGAIEEEKFDADQEFKNRTQWIDFPKDPPLIYTKGSMAKLKTPSLELSNPPYKELFSWEKFREFNQTFKTMEKNQKTGQKTPIVKVPGGVAKPLFHMGRFLFHENRAAVAAGWGQAIATEFAGYLSKPWTAKQEEKEDETADRKKLSKMLKRMVGSLDYLDFACGEEQSKKWLKEMKTAAKKSEREAGDELKQFYTAMTSKPKETKWDALLAQNNKSVTMSQCEDKGTRDALIAATKGQGTMYPAIKALSDALSPVLVDYITERMAQVGDGLVPGSIQPGPTKTKDRMMAKVAEYAEEALDEPFQPRWKILEEAVKGTALEGKGERFEAAILDYCRVSVAFFTPNDLLKGLRALMGGEAGVLGIKNGYATDAFVPPSQYRDLKALLMFPVPENLFDGQAANEAAPKIPQGGAFFIVEIQLLLKTWLDCKKSTSMSYKVRRANDWKFICNDFQKYVVNDDKGKEPREILPTLAKFSDLASYKTWGEGYTADLPKPKKKRARQRMGVKAKAA